MTEAQARASVVGVVIAGLLWVLREDNLYLNLTLPLAAPRPGPRSFFDRFQRLAGRGGGRRPAMVGRAGAA